MAVKIRLSRIGRKARPFYKVVVMDSRNARDGKWIEQIGRFNPFLKEFNVDESRVEYWLSQGAQVSDTVHRHLFKKGLLPEIKRQSSQQGIPKKDREQKNED